MKKKNRGYILLAVAYLLALSVLCTGCEKTYNEKTYNEKITSYNEKITPYNEKITPYKYDMINYRTQEANLYNFTEQLADMEHVVMTVLYGNDSILMYELTDGNEPRKKVWLFSYLTGEKKLCSDLSAEAEKEYFVSPDRFLVLSAKPFVFLDVYMGKICIYTDDFSGYSTMSFEEYPTPLGMFVREGGFYFMDFHTCKGYRHELGEYRNTAKQMNYITFREESQIVFVPASHMGSSSLDCVSEDGSCLRIYAECLRDNKPYYYIYNIQTQTFEEMYRFEDDGDTLWNSWNYEKSLSSIEPSSEQRYKMTDYEDGKVYETKIEPELIYCYVDYDPNLSAEQNKVLFFAVDVSGVKISELFLWDYANAKSETADRQPEKIYSEIPQEIDYADVTDKAEFLEEKYGINIIMGENVTVDFDAYAYEQVTDEQRIYYALERLELAMNTFPDGMCAEMAADYALGFNVYLCGTITAKYDEIISEAGAFFIFDNGYYNLVMNIKLDNLESNLIHEMTHAIDSYFISCGAAAQLVEDWQACNPEGFEYIYSYFDYEGEFEYTYFDDFEDINEVYFCDMYAKTFPTEDRSRIFEYFGSEYYEGDLALESQPLRKKARLLLDYCTEYMECFTEDEEYGLKINAEELGW